MRPLPASRGLSGLVVIALVGLALGHAGEAGAAPGPSIPIDGRSFSKPLGSDRSRFPVQTDEIEQLYAVNVGEKHPPYEGWCTQEDFHRISGWGFNSIRLLLIWDAIEPEPGEYDENYLRMIDERIAWARNAGLGVVLDMHQDLYGPKIPGGDGAPEWATRDQGKPHIFPGGVWSMAYYTSPMVQASFDSFWSNAPGPGGVGLQERYAAMWRHVAGRYADNSTVIGHDLMNEPFIGGRIGVFQTEIAPIIAPHLGMSASSPVHEMLGVLGQPERIIEALSKAEVFSAVLEKGTPIFQEFERVALQPMYQRVADAIREVDRRHWLFIEPSVSANTGFRSAIQPVRGKDGKTDPLQAYAPHAYDLVTETALAGQVSAERMKRIVSELRAHADEMGLPLFVGEWGAYPNSEEGARCASEMMEILSEARAGHAYWVYSRDFKATACFKPLTRKGSGRGDRAVPQ
ncbi:MAG: cellulase family glycosylhydrolase [Candidatus Omnitrophica bacterium]|nr:cellulase family glycosylhydrolase [Candidatus Omnitrophota bacterium]